MLSEIYTVIFLKMITIDRMEGGQCRKYNNFSQDIKFVENTISDKAR